MSRENTPLYACTTSSTRFYTRALRQQKQDRAPDDVGEWLHALFLEVVVEHAYDWMSAAS